MESIKPRLVAVQFSKSESPAYINAGDGWPIASAVELLDKLDLKFASSRDDGEEIKFDQRDRIDRKLGALQVEPMHFAGVDLVLQKAAA